MLKHATITRPSVRLTSNDKREINHNINDATLCNLDESSILCFPTTPTKQQSKSIITPIPHSTIKVFTQSLSQDVAYKTLRVTTQTRSCQIVRSLLKKFRLKHKDPNSYYLTLERWIWKDGHKSRNTMVLSDDACPLQLQRCCSNPPHNDIEFTLRMRAGDIVKIYCSEVVQDARYKCLSLSTQTTVEETIELMLHCLNLTDSQSVRQEGPTSRITSSPVSTRSTESSSSGIESDPASQCLNLSQHHKIVGYPTGDSDDRFMSPGSHASSFTSISSCSNMSNLSSSLTEQYSLIIECKDPDYSRCLQSNEYLVHVYQCLMVEAKRRCMLVPLDNHKSSPVPGEAQISLGLVNYNPDQWFSINLIKRDDYNLMQWHQQSPMSLNQQKVDQVDNSNLYYNIKHENKTNNNNLSTENLSSSTLVNGHFSSHSFGGQSNGHNTIINMAQRQIESNNEQQQSKPPSLPRKFVMLPPIKPRRNLFNVNPSITNITQQRLVISPSKDNRRRYDPARLAEDLSRLDTETSDTLSIR